MGKLGAGLMAARRKMTKTEVLTIRLDPRTRFVLDFASRVSGQTISTVIERAIASYADSLEVHTIDRDGRETQVGWRELWNVKDAVRALNVLRCTGLHPSYEEERQLDFIREYWPFFAYEEELLTYKTSSLVALWPHLDHFIEVRDAQKTAGRLAVVNAMNEVLQQAGLPPPPWPPSLARIKEGSDVGEIPSDPLDVPF